MSSPAPWVPLQLGAAGPPLSESVAARFPQLQPAASEAERPVGRRMCLIAWFFCSSLNLIELNLSHF